MAKTYPRHHYENGTAARYPRMPRRCAACKELFESRQVPIIIETIEYNWFRGDDDVNFYHPACDPRKVQVVER